MNGTTVGDIPPTVENESVFRWWDYIFFLVLTALNSTAIIHFAVHWFSLEDWRYNPASVWVVTLLLAYNLSMHQFRWFSLLLMRRPKAMPLREGWKVGVVTTFVPGAESLEMLEETVSALITMEYPHDTWVLDEGDDDRVKALCARLGAQHFSRKHLAQYHTESGVFQSRSKHGNYNAWFHEIGFTHYEIIVAFDPDHVPVPAFLANVLGYFEDSRIGYVQAAQVYYNQNASFIARGAAEETYAYYSVTQMASYPLGFPIVTGCHNAHRTAALKQVGGFAPHDADDLLITLLYRVSHWQGVYVPKILAKGLTPVDWSGYLAQQRRWARSVLDIKFRAYAKLVGRLPFKERILGFLHGLYYLKGLTTCVAVGLLAFMLSTNTMPQFLSYFTLVQLIIVYAVLQASEFYKQRFFLGGRAEWGLHWRAVVLQLAKWPSLVLALIDVLFNRRHAYSLTPKVKTKANHYMLVRSHLLVVATLLTAWTIGVVSGHDLPPVLHLWAAIMVSVSLVLMWTESWIFPAPYNKDLWDRQSGAISKFRDRAWDHICRYRERLSPKPRPPVQ